MHARRSLIVPQTSQAVFQPGMQHFTWQTSTEFQPLSAPCSSSITAHATSHNTPVSVCSPLTTWANPQMVMLSAKEGGGSTQHHHFGKGQPSELTSEGLCMELAVWSIDYWRCQLGWASVSSARGMSHVSFQKDVQPTSAIGVVGCIQTNLSRNLRHHCSPANEFCQQ